MNAIMDATNTTSVAMPTIDILSQTCITTTLYDLISAIQSLVEPNDDLVVAIVQRLLNSDCLTWGTDLATGKA